MSSAASDSLKDLQVPPADKIRWIQLKNNSFEGTKSFIDSIVYSPDSRFGLTISFFNLTFNCRLIEMATGESLEYYFRKEYYPNGKDPFVYYFIDELRFVLVSYEESIGVYEQQLYKIDKDKKEITNIGYPIRIDADFSTGYDFRIGDRRGCEPIVIKGKRFLVLPSVGGFVLVPYNPLLSDPCNPKQKCIYLSFSLNKWRVLGYNFSNLSDQFHCFGSKIYFSASKTISPFGPGVNFEDSDIIRQHFDKMVVLDLAGLDLEKNVIVLTEESAKLSVVDLKQFRRNATYTSFRDYSWNQDGKYLMAEEIKEIAPLAYKRPANKKKLYVVDLEKLTSTLNWIRVREDCTPTIYNNNLLIWRSRLPTDRGSGIKRGLLYNTTIYEYKIARIPTASVSSLQVLIKNYFMLGKSGLTLPEEYISRYFEC